jgi:signal peptidase I
MLEDIQPTLNALGVRNASLKTYFRTFITYRPGDRIEYKDSKISVVDGQRQIEAEVNWYGYSTLKNNVFKDHGFWFSKPSWAGGDSNQYEDLLTKKDANLPTNKFNDILAVIKG